MGAEDGARTVKVDPNAAGEHLQLPKKRTLRRSAVEEPDSWRVRSEPPHIVLGVSSTKSWLWIVLLR
jgi:hypothetical protein